MDPRPADHRPADAGPDTAEAIGRVVAFLRTMERRDLDAARTFVASDFTMCFPGSAVMQRLEDLVARSSLRYRHVAKDFDTIDACIVDDRIVVYCAGRLRGEWVDGTSFAGIRFIDRFELRGGLIVRQDVWNDVGAVTR